MGEANFEWALEQLKNGAALKREGWNNPNRCIILQKPSEDSKMTLPYIYIINEEVNRVPWFASQVDMFATDWKIVAER